MGIVGVFPLHAFYPLMKRWTWWPQAWLGEIFPEETSVYWSTRLTVSAGLAFNWGIPVAWISVTGTMPPPAIWILFLGGVWYVMIHLHILLDNSGLKTSFSCINVTVGRSSMIPSTLVRIVRTTSG